MFPQVFLYKNINILIEKKKKIFTQKKKIKKKTTLETCSSNFVKPST